MLQELRRFPLAAILVLATAVTACGGDDPADPDDDDDGTVDVTFTFTPPAGAPDVVSVLVPGEFNLPDVWDETNTEYAMTESGGTWSLTVELEPGTYQYKYYINGAWIIDMCNDATWGAAGTGDVSPQAEECNIADNNNAMITVAAE